MVGVDTDSHSDSDLPDADTRALPVEVREELAALGGSLPEAVGRLLAAVREEIETNAAMALEHAQRARTMAPRSASAREALGVAAYRCGDYATARRELLAARRMSGNQGLLPVIADCERGLGVPERAIELGRSAQARTLRGADAAEMLLVVAGARLDLGQPAAAVALLRGPAEASRDDQTWAGRLRYGYAAALDAQGDREGAAAWFRLAAAADATSETDAHERLESCKVELPRS